MSTFAFPKTTTVASTTSTNPISTAGVGLGSFTPLTNTGGSPAGGMSFGSFGTPSTGVGTFGTPSTGVGTFGTPSTGVGTFSTPAATSAATGFYVPSTTKPGFNLLGTSFGQQPAAATTASSIAAKPGWFSTPTTAVQQTGTSTTATTTTTTTTTTGFSTGITTTSAPTGFTLWTPATTSTTGYSLGVATATATTATTATTAATGFSFGVSAASTATATSTGSSLAAPTTAVAATSSLPVSSSPTVKSTTAQVKFSQLEENINKWTIELEEQEKVFMNQVAHINEWDRLLLSNGDKIVSLNNNVEKVKLEQQQLDRELDFIVAQQRELEECLLPLEKEFANITVSDPERDATYRLAENLNTQLRHMSEDLKEIIEDINEKNKNQDTTDPIVQIGRILNAHMNSLQWVDQNTTLIKQQLDQVTKLTEIHRRENDSTQNL